ncbi:MAG: glycosyl hydrolase 115 family protein, partial [Tepidisphaeraceae bacterium]
DLFAPWRRQSTANSEMWLEAALRLKLNTIEWDDGGRDYTVPDTVSPTTKLISDYGLIYTTHHHTPLNASLTGWANYWAKRKKAPAPELSIANLKAIEEYWQYNVDCIVKNNIETLWVIGFRGAGDHPFWYTFKDAPASMKDRGKLISRVLQDQHDMVTRAYGQAKPQFRSIFYDELSDLLAKGFITPPRDPSLIWTYVATRRDHYPNKDLQQLSDHSDRRLGYYFNYQFTSTGSHLAAAEGPWKMEQNYRFVQRKTRYPIGCSVVNAGNIREYVMELSANAAMMWDFNAYSSDAFVKDFCSMYFGAEHAEKASKLYKSYYDAYWQQKRPDLEGFDRQYIFQDLRYKSAILAICREFGRRTDQAPLKDLRNEQEAGRTYHIVPEDSGADNQIDAIIKGTSQSAEAFLRVAQDADALYAQLDELQKPIFNDNLRQPAHYMYGLNVCLCQLAKGYASTDPAVRKRSVSEALAALTGARDALQSTQHGVFSNWYAGDRVFGFKKVIAAVEQLSAEK